MIGQLSKSGRWLARVALVPTNPDAGRSPRSTTSRRDAPTQRASEALTTRRLGDDRTERDSVPAMTDVDRIYLGETDRRYVCDGCDGWCRWSGWATLAGGSASRPTAAWAGPDTGPLDRPAPGTPYRCTRCGREHVGAPGAQRTNVTIAPKGARVSEMRIRRSIERRQALLLDGIRMSIEMAQIGYRRLQSAARRRQAVERSRRAIARRVGTCGHAEPTTVADQPHDLRAGRVHQTGDGDREFNVDVANGGS